jgi:hypothetical protein
MAAERRGNTVIDVGSVRVSGLAAPVRQAEMRHGVEATLSEQLAAATPTDGARRIAIDTLRLRLPHAASAKDVARALGRAIARGRRGERP